LASADAVLHEIRYRNLKGIVDEFCRNEGPELHKELVAYDRRNKHTSYISEPWFDMYLSDRVPCPVNYNPFMTYSPDPNAAYNDQLARATNFVISYGRMKRSLDACVLEPEVFHMNPKKSDTKFFRTVCKSLPPSLSWFGAVAFKAFPLDMSQYNSLFGGSRIPQKGKDRLFHCPDPKHFIVLRAGNICSVDLFDSDGLLLSPEKVHACLATILSNTVAKPNPDECVSSLTSLDRDSWAKVREELSSVGDNAACLRAIDSALFALCLDSLDSEDPQRLTRSLLYGDNASNRWFDKCFQLIVDARGQATINFEHSWGDGVAVLRLMEESYRDTNNNHFVDPGQRVDNAVDINKHCRQIKFTLNDSLKSKIAEAQSKHAQSTSGLQFGMVDYAGLNRESIKKSKLSPDSVMQLAIQLAFYRLYKDFVPTYESCSTAAFLKGRTECMRSATKATQKAVLAIEKKSINAPKELLTECSNVHNQLVKEASMGQGFDRHLMGLRVTAQRLGRKEPALFSDSNYKFMNEFILSTSTLSTDTICFGGFGPVVRNGFGIGYVVAGSRLGAVISSYKVARSSRTVCSAFNYFYIRLNHRRIGCYVDCEQRS
uniref:Carn_acyltransf domain-containing protein n=1 Tax=Toxocara canis TaxID=6265 RepID=A0A183UWF9_TOXCA